MDESLLLPDVDVFVSNIQSIGKCLTIRLLSYCHPDAEQPVFVLVAEDVVNASEAFGFLERCRVEQTYLYTSRKAESISFETESGEKLLLHAGRFSSTPTAFNEEELNEVLRRVWGWYVSENRSCQAASARIQAARQLLADANQRIELKALGHPSGTSAILYAQQLRLIGRVLDALAN